MPTEATGRLLRKRNSWRNHECSGCRSNIYNWPEWSGGDERDLTASAAKLDDDYVCFNLAGAKRARARTGDRRKRVRVAHCHQGAFRR